MLSCADCATAVPEGAIRCPVCGMPVGSAAPTVFEMPRAAFGASGASVQHRPDFATGAVLASRYQIVTLLGRGGMGEVYRADDLKLNQAVALKFLPPAQSSDAAALDRLRREVRLARQISHPNVCRVFDLGEIEDASFLCMEYIDGEDLACLLRRIGRLPLDKALEIARQLAAGLAAIHEGGLFHRDLKPGNVMIDGRGRARITDFGLAIPADEPRGDAGTPAYMAPEQLAGGQVSVRSDLFSLGLVIYEMLTGQPAPAAGREAPALPESLSDRVSPGVRTALLRCLAPDPLRRPSSALQVLAALTGQDPLTLAVADGLTLSPEAVAAAPAAGSLRPAAALTLFCAALSCLAGVIALAGRVQPLQQIPAPRSPDVLADRARSLLHELGYRIPARDWKSGFSFHDAYRKYLEADFSSAEMRRLLTAGQPPLYAFWYRTSPDLLRPANFSLRPGDLPGSNPGDAYVELDLQGRLYHLEINPARNGSAGKAMAQPDWRPLLAVTGLDATRLRAVPPLQVPPVFADSRAAWEGEYPVSSSRPAIPIRIEAAALQGVPVWLEITGPWSRYDNPRPGHEGTGTSLMQAYRVAFLSAVFLSGFLLARRNLRLGRGDSRGALRVAVLTFSFYAFGWLLDGEHPLHHLEASLNEAIIVSFGVSLLIWMLYLGFEPSVRRLWPERLISWNRLLTGRLRDPLVGRDVLAGCLLGLGKALLIYVKELPKSLAFERPLSLTLTGGLQGPVKVFLSTLFDGLGLSLEFMLLLLALRILLRREGIAVAILWALLTWGIAIPGPYTGLNLACSGLGAFFMAFAWVRFGPLAGMTLSVTGALCLRYPLTLDTSVWYADSGLFAIFIITALACYGFATSVAGQPWFARSGVLDD